MSKEKQIEEMARARCWGGAIKGRSCEECFNDSLYKPDECEWKTRVAKTLYDAGYRKQEWISVEDKLPEQKKLVLCRWQRVYDNDGHYGFATYQEHGAWYVLNEGLPTVTHWMYLPEPPKIER